MNNTSLTFQLLEAPLIIKNYVKSDPVCNYEIYITEIINSSIWMKNHYELPFTRPVSESNGECDVYANKYGLDYKLIASKTALQGRSIFSVSVERIAKGVVSFGSSKNTGSMEITRLPQALRKKTIEELKIIHQTEYKKQCIDNDIHDYLDTIATKKNLLLFFPYRFQFNKAGILNEDVKAVISCIQDDFGESFRYRESLNPGHDTFFLTIYDYYFVLCSWNNNALSLLDIIPVEESESFMHLALDYCDGWSEKYDIILQEIRKESTNEVKRET